MEAILEAKANAQWRGVVEQLQQAALDRFYAARDQPPADCGKLVLHLRVLCAARLAGFEQPGQLSFELDLSRDHPGVDYDHWSLDTGGQIYTAHDGLDAVAAACLVR